MVLQEAFVQFFLMVSLDFFIKCIPAVLMFCLPLERKAHFRVRIFCLPFYVLLYSAFTSYLGIVLTGILPGNLNLNLYIQHILLLFGIFTIQLSLFQCSTSALLFNLLGGQALRETCLYLFYLIYYRIPLFSDLSTTSFQYYAIQAIWYIFAYFVAYNIFIKKQNTSTSNDMDPTQPSLYLSIGISLFLIAFNLVRTSEVERATTLDTMCILCLIFFFSLILVFRSGLLKSIETEKEIMLTKKVWAEKEKSLKLTADAINVINIKYHDLKHLASRLRTDATTLELVTGITDSLKDYEHMISTGNDTLDMILTEQALKFNQANIDFSCIADGAALSFMSSIDLISLFSNALDNAYEAVLPLAQERREVYLTVKRAVGMVSICVENPCFSNPVMKNGLPVTSKRNHEYHGFGMKSIKSTTEKYGGNMSVSVTNNQFVLKILIPEPL